MQRTAGSLGVHDPAEPFFAAYARAIIAEGPVTFRSSVERALTESGREPHLLPDHLCEAAAADYVAGIELLPWATQLLNAYAHLPKAIVSNGPYDMQLSALKKFGLDTRVDGVIISGNPAVGVRKPNPAIFLLACERLGVRPGRTLMIGDNEEVDVKGAKVAGLQARMVSAVIKKKSVLKMSSSWNMQIEWCWEHCKVS